MKKLIPWLIFFFFLALSEKSFPQWIKQNSGTTERLTDAVMLDSSTAIAVGENQTIIKTTNSGETWNFVGTPWSFIITWKNISFYDKQNGVLVGGNNVFTTTDGGDYWSLSYQSYEKNFLSALYIDMGHIYVGDDSGFVYHSIDSGKTWASEKISAYPIRSIFAYRGPTILGLPLYALTSNSILRKNEFYPITPWEEKEFDFFHGLGSEAFSGESCNGGGSTFIVGVQGDWRAAPAILRQKMSDTSWSQANLFPSPDGELYGVSAPSSSTIYACGSSGLVFKTTDGGDNWILHSVPTTQTLHSINFFNNTKGFAVGDSGTILFTSNGGLTGVEEGTMPIPKIFLLFQNYPNPFNPSTKISWQSPVGSWQTLKIYDVLGNEVATLVDEWKEAESYSVNFNANNLSSGIYFYTLHAGNFDETKKLILTK